MLLELLDLKVRYGGARIINGVSMGLEEGNIVCLIGANGAGKTTILRTISGLKRPYAGEIKFQGKTIHHVSPPNILGMGIVHVPQEARIWPDMTVYENLKMGAYLRRDKEEINKDLERVYGYFPKLEERCKQRAGSLSGGERQWLAIGRALMSKPRVLLMDEPSAGLAPLAVRGIGDIILRINRAHISILLVEQNADLALDIARYGYVLERGKIVLENTTQDLSNDQKVKTAYLGI